MAHRTASECDVTLRPRGSARVAHAGVGGADAWQGATRTGHADARQGRHVARLVSGGPTGIVLENLHVLENLEHDRRSIVVNRGKNRG